jgi:FtsX-like permease family
VIRLGLRITLGGGKQAAARLTVVAVAVAIGVTLLLITLAGINAIGAQNQRAAWLATGSAPAQLGATSAPAAAGADPLWWLVTTGRFGTQAIYRADVAATGPRSPIPPGIPHLPGPGQYYASPALSALLRSTPAAELGDRFGGTQIGLIGPAALPTPNTLIIVTGQTASQLSKVPGAEEVTTIQTTPGSGNGPAGLSAPVLQAILAAAAVALLFPVLIFIGAATRLSAARREQRFAAIRLAGGTPRQVAVLAATEAAIAATAGTAAGFALFYALRPALQHVSFTGEPFSPGDLSLHLADILLVAVGIPAAAAISARVALRRVRLSPLGVARRATPPPPRAWQVIPLLAGLGWLAAELGIARSQGTSSKTLAYLLAFLLILAGLVIAGPWLTMAGSRVMARLALRRTSRPAMLIAGRRLADDPRGAFRAVSGLILALFVTTVAAGVITTSIATQRPHSGTAASDTLVDHFYTATSAQTVTSVPAVPAAVLARLSSVPGVYGVTVIHTDPLPGPAAQPDLLSFTGLVSCAQLSRLPVLGRCAPGAKAAMIGMNLGVTTTPLSAHVWPTAAISPGRLQHLPVQAVAAGTSGSAAAIEQARTILSAASPYIGAPATIGEGEPTTARTIAELLHMTEVVIVASLVIAGCSLAVSVAGGLTDRQRPFSLLRLSGVPLGVLRRVLTLETAVPLLVSAVLSAGAGLLAAGLFTRSALSLSFHPPGTEYYIIVTAGLVASLAVIASGFPLLRRITGPEAARDA